ncbi:MAG: plasmid pRiA4b ORF-3 family protein [Phycisphaerae bacterium]|nr:plasmid pRiA4b ORF-3 family protein [Phycisphaerae bacterium]
MPTKTQPAAGKVHELKITLRGSKPPIWRRVAVASDCTLAELHEIVQMVMGWMNEHLHQFRLKVAVKKPSSQELVQLMQSGRWDEIELRTRGERVFTDMSIEDLEDEDERRFTLGELCPKVKSKLLYEYDFGDGWEHTIAVVKVYPPEDGVHYPICLAGKRACPPEDCGGIWGYYEMLEAVGDPRHPEHEDFVDWLGDEFDPDTFDLEEANAVLRQWRRHPRLRTGKRRTRAQRKS